jgi:hypothetical protein
MICRALRWLLCVGVAGLAFAQPGAAFAYSVGSGSTATGPTGIAANTPFTFLATFVQPDGTPVPAGQTVTFSQQSGPGTAAVPPSLLRIDGQWQRIVLAQSTCQAAFNPAATTTDSGGRAATTVTLPGGCPGLFVLAATLSGGGTVTFTVVETGGFPNTTTDPSQSQSWWLLVAGAVALCAIAVLGVRMWSTLRGRWN